MINWIIENWYCIVGILVFVIVAGFAIYKFCKLSKESQIKKAKEWLLYAVSKAEKELKGGTGNLKLRMVYDGFVSKFKFLSMIISFQQFSDLVDVALVQMEEMLKENSDIKKVITEEQKTLEFGLWDSDGKEIANSDDVNITLNSNKYEKDIEQ